MQVKAREVGNQATCGGRGFLTTNIQKKVSIKRRKVEASQKLLFFLFSWELFSEEELFFLLMILPCLKFCQVTSLGVVPRSRKVLLQLSVGTSNGFKSTC